MHWPDPDVMYSFSLNADSKFSAARISPLWLALERALDFPSAETLAALRRVIFHQTPGRVRTSLNRLKVPDSMQYPLGLAASRGALEVVELLLEGGARVEGNRRWLSPLHEAAFGGERVHLQIIERLLAKGACVEGKCLVGDDTPLMTATENSNVDILTLLLRAGAQVNRTKA